MQKTLTPQELTLNVSLGQFSFVDTSALLVETQDNAQYQAWVAQAEAKKAAEFGLSIQQSGFNLLALGEPGSGRTTLMTSVMHDAAKKWPAASDLVALYQFEGNGKPLFMKLPAGAGVQLKQALDSFVRVFAKDLASLLEAKVQQNSIAPLQIFLDGQLSVIKASLTLIEPDKMPTHYFNTLKKDILESLENWQPTTSPDGESNLEALISESFFWTLSCQRVSRASCNTACASALR